MWQSGQVYASLVDILKDTPRYLKKHLGKSSKMKNCIPTKSDKISNKGQIY